MVAVAEAAIGDGGRVVWIAVDWFAERGTDADADESAEDEEEAT